MGAWCGTASNICSRTRGKNEPAKRKDEKKRMRQAKRAQKLACLKLQILGVPAGVPLRTIKVPINLCVMCGCVFDVLTDSWVQDIDNAIARRLRGDCCQTAKLVKR